MSSTDTAETRSSNTAPWKKEIGVHCIDGGVFNIGAAMLEELPFLNKEDDKISFDFPLVVLQNLVKWISQYKINGTSQSKLVVPCLFQNFSYVTTDPWDKIFFLEVTSAKNAKYFIPTINAAEKYNITGLMEFLCVGLGCKLRGQDEDVKEILGVSNELNFSEEELMNVSHDYAWFEEAVQPKTEALSL